MSKSAERKARRLVEDGRCEVKKFQSRKCGESLMKLEITKAYVYFLLRMAAFLGHDRKYNKVDAAMGINSYTSRVFTRVIDVFIISSELKQLRKEHKFTFRRIEYEHYYTCNELNLALLFHNSDARKEFRQREKQGLNLYSRRSRAVFLFNCVQAAQYLYKKIKQINSRVAVIPVSTFNIKGTVQNDKYKHFLEGVFSKLGCDLYLLQELLWVATSKIWPKTIFPDCAIDIRATRREAGVVTNGAGIAVRSLDTVNFNNEYLLGRICCCRIIVPRTFEVQTRLIRGKRRSRLACVEDSSEYLQFLSLSFHGRHKLRKEYKEESIKTFIEHVRKCCEREKLPAIIGGDFNYDIRNIRWKRKDHIKIYSPDHRYAIDFLCTVHEDTFATKMTLVPEFARCQDITENVPEKLKGKITNHLPLVGFIMLYDTPGVSEKGLALELSK